MPTPETRAHAPTTDVAGPSFWQRNHLAPGSLNEHLRIILASGDTPIVPHIDFHTLLEPSPPGDIKGKSPLRVIRGSDQSRFSLHAAPENHVRLAIREPSAKTRSVYFNLADAPTETALLQALDESYSDRTFPYAYAGYQPLGADIAAQTRTVASRPTYDMESAWNRLRECPPFVHASVPHYLEIRYYASQRDLPSIKGSNQEKLVAAFYTMADVVFLTRVHAPFWKKMTTSSSERLRAYVAPAGGAIQGPYCLDVTYRGGTKRMEVLGLVQLRDARVPQLYLSHRFAQYSIDDKKAEWIID